MSIVNHAMLHHLLQNASWRKLSGSTFRWTKASRAGAVHRAALVSVEALENRQLLSAGQLDTSFGAGGQVLLDAHGEIHASAVQSDGKIILAGGTLLPTGSSPNSFLVERLTADGALDASFGTGGIVTTSFASDAIAVGVVIESDGKILVGGGQFLARYTANGTLDSTFGAAGKESFGASSHVNIQSLAVESDGKIAVAGRTTVQDPAHPTDASYLLQAVGVSRLTATGALDTTFNGTGTVLQQNRDAFNAVLNAGVTPTTAVAIQSDGKILVGADSSVDPAIWRFNTDGTIDTSFGHGGMALQPLSFYDINDDLYNAGMISKLIVQPDGKILAGGFYNFQSVPYDQLMVSRFNADGSVDTTFGTKTSNNEVGITLSPNTINAGFGPTATIALQPDGKILLGGSNASGSDEITRLSAAGIIDSTFSFDAEAAAQQGIYGRTPSLNLTPDGQILLVDNALISLPMNGFASKTAVIRVQDNYVASTSTPATTATVNVSAGGIDPTFGSNNGIVITDPTLLWFSADTQRTVRATAVQADGKVLIAGSVGTVASFGIGKIFVERLNVDGSVDTTFGTNGVVLTTIGAFSVANAIVIQSDGKIIIGGVTEDSATSPTNQKFALARYTAAGVLDATYGTAGIVTTDFTGNEQVDALRIDSSGRVVAVGSYFANPDVGFHVTRYTTGGALDSTFNSTGELTVDLGGPVANAPAFATALTLQSDGKLLIGSHDGADGAIYRYNSNGTLDSAFGTSGVFTVANSGFPISFSAISALSNGSIVAALVSVGNPQIVRLSSAGVLDTSFGFSGVATIAQIGALIAQPQDPTFPTYININLVLPQSDGGIVVVGAQPALEGSSSGVGELPRVIKLASDGTTDSTFTDSADPHFVAREYYRGEVVRGAALAPDGSIVMAIDAFNDGATSLSGSATGIDAPHLIGLTRYLTAASSFQLPVPASGVDYTPANTGGNPGDGGNNPPGDGGGGGSPLPAGQLTATFLTVPPRKALGGTRGVLNIQIKNKGATAFAGPISIELFSSLDSTVSLNDAKLTTLTLASLTLKPGKTRTIRVPFNYSSIQVTGSYDILANLVETSSGTASYVAVSKRAVQLTMPQVILNLKVDPAGPLTLKTGKKTRAVLIIKNTGTVTAVGMVTGILYAINSAGAGSVQLAEKTIRHFRLAKNATQRLAVDYVPVNTFGNAFKLEVAMTSDVKPTNPSGNSGQALIDVTLV